MEYYFGWYRDVVTSAEAVSTARAALKKKATPQEVAEKLTQMAIKRYTKDNIAVVVVDLAQGPLAKHTNGGKADKKRNGWKLF